MSSQNTHYPKLFAPFQLAGRTVRNRIVHASISLAMPHPAGRISPQHLQYCVNRARGGAGMFVTEAMLATPVSGGKRIAIWDPAMAGELARWADMVESEDCRLIGQIAHAGRGWHHLGRTFGAVAPSALPDDLSWSVPQAMSREHIATFIRQVAESARRLHNAGFSGVEISAGHGHLFHQFMSPWSNRREDEYGGSLEGRARFLVELCQALRAVCGDAFILGIKFPGDDGVPGGIGPELAAQTVAHLVGQVRPDYLCYAQGAHHHSLEMHVPNDSYPRLPYMAMVRGLRAAAPGVPVVGLGRITDPAEAEAILVRGDAELIGLGRALIADPSWPLRAMQGKASEIRYCVSHNTCWKSIIHRPLVCDNNPRVGAANELDFRPDPVAQPRRVVVVGAGVAGLEAAWTAAARGHAVTVLGASREIGGKTRLHARLPSSESLSSVFDYQRMAAERAGVRLVLGRRASTSDILGLQPDVVVLATGATMGWPLRLPAELQAQAGVPDLREALLAVVGRTARQSGRAVILDMDHTEGTYAAAELLADIFDEVVLLTPRDRVAEDVALVTRQSILRRLDRRRIRVQCLVEPRWSESFESEARLEYASVFGGSLRSVENVSFLAYATPRVPDDALAAPLIAAGVEVHRIGDCKVARGVLEATAEGHAIGMAL